MKDDSIQKSRKTSTVERPVYEDIGTIVNVPYDELLELVSELHKTHEIPEVRFVSIDDSVLEVVLDIQELRSLKIYDIRNIHDTALLEKLACKEGLENLMLGLESEERDLSFLKDSSVAKLELHCVGDSHVDFDMLSRLEHLSRLDIVGTNTPCIDLTPLSHSPLTEIHMHGGYNAGGNGTNPERVILMENETVEIVIIANSPITTLDLSPLTGCPRLRWLNLGGNMFKQLELTPLSQCKTLEFIGLDKNPSLTVDITPLLDCPRLTEIYTSWGNEPQFLLQRSKITEEARLRKIMAFQMSGMMYI